MLTPPVVESIMKTKNLILASLIAVAAVPAFAAGVQNKDPYTNGQAVTKADPYTDGARKADVYTDGAVRKADPYTDAVLVANRSTSRPRHDDQHPGHRRYRQSAVPWRAARRTGHSRLRASR